MAAATTLSWPVAEPAKANVTAPVLPALIVFVWGFAPVTVKVMDVPLGLVTLVMVATKDVVVLISVGGRWAGVMRSCGMTLVGVQEQVPLALVTFSIVVDCVA